MPIYLAGHLTPDHDSICSCLALSRFLNKLGKETYILLEEKDRFMTSIYSGEYDFVESVQHTDYCFIALDLNDLPRLGIFKDYFDNASQTINIDHHQNNRTDANLILTHPEKCATCEIIYEIIKSYGSEYLDLTTCELLYTGIMTDTSCFSRRLSQNTFAIAQKLINKGVEYEKFIRATFSHRTLYELKALAELVQEIQFDDGVYYLIIDKSKDQFKDLTHNQITKTIAEELRKIEDIDTFLIFILESDKIVGKAMSNVTKNANVIAGLFGGGGHKGEAGFTVSRDTTVESMIEKTKEFIKNH